MLRRAPSPMSHWWQRQHAMAGLCSVGRSSTWWVKLGLWLVPTWTVNGGSGTGEGGGLQEHLIALFVGQLCLRLRRNFSTECLCRLSDRVGPEGFDGAPGAGGGWGRADVVGRADD